jgi:hypothetical protein
MSASGTTTMIGDDDDDHDDGELQVMGSARSLS